MSAKMSTIIVKMESAPIVKDIIFAIATKDIRMKAAEQEKIISTQLVFQVNMIIRE